MSSTNTIPISTGGSNTVNLSKLDIRIYYSSAQNGDALYQGGFRTNQELSDNYLHNFFQRTTEAEQITGITKYRCGYIYNANPTIYIKNPILYVVQNTSSPNDTVEVGWGSADIGTGLVADDDGSVEQIIPDEHDTPSDVDFYDGNTKSDGAILGEDIPPLKCKAFWIRYISNFNAEVFPRNTFVLRLSTDNLPHNVIPSSGGVNLATITIPMIAECGSTANFTKLINSILALNPDFITTAGNNNLESNPPFFLSNLQTYLNKLLIGFGSRDVINTTISNAYVNAISGYNFAMDISQRYYSKDYGNIHILMMDTSGDDLYTNPSDQYAFVENDLQTAFANANIDWIIVVSNRTMYSSQTTSAIRLIYPDLRDTYHQLFVKYGVLAVIQGTFHFYERTKVLGYNEVTPDVPKVFPYNGPTNYTIRGKKSFMDGCLFFNIGTGGGSYDIINPIAPYSQVRDTGDTGYLWIRADNTGLHKKLTFRYYATSRTSQVFIDEVTVTNIG